MLYLLYVVSCYIIPYVCKCTIVHTRYTSQIKSSKDLKSI